MPQTDRPSSPLPTTRVWDVPVRIFHWSLVVLLGFSWWSGEQHEMEWHRLSGYGILALLIFRIYWGFFGSRTARFAHFLRGPHAVFAYVRTLGKNSYTAKPGHNPLGGWSVVLMLAAVGAMVTAGLFAVDVDGLESGPLADYVSFDQGRIASDIHETLFTILLVIVTVHVLAILFYLLGLKHNIIGPMIHGRSRARHDDAVERRDPSLWHMAIGVILAALCTYTIAQGFHF